jgi:hypothetical protein
MELTIQTASFSCHKWTDGSKARYHTVPKKSRTSLIYSLKILEIPTTRWQNHHHHLVQSATIAPVVLLGPTWPELIVMPLACCDRVVIVVSNNRPDCPNWQEGCWSPKFPHWIQYRIMLLILLDGNHMDMWSMGLDRDAPLQSIWILPPIDPHCCSHCYCSCGDSISKWRQHEVPIILEWAILTLGCVDVTRIGPWDWLLIPCANHKCEGTCWHWPWLAIRPSYPTPSVQPLHCCDNFDSLTMALEFGYRNPTTTSHGTHSFDASTGGGSCVGPVTAMFLTA